MDKIGIALRSEKSAESLRDDVIEPLRTALKEEKAGIYTNYLRQHDPDSEEPTEHLIVFEVNDFKKGIRVLRLTLDKLNLLEKVQFQNLNPSTPGY